MGMFVNRVELIGNLGRDPEIRHTASGKKIATLNIATSESWKDTQSGEWRERTEWHRVVISTKHSRVSRRSTSKRA
jgi:single-strand DNA-binding protein